ncbi:hypothetical protein CEXT_520691 [Caerostris extrusa]|uniref:Uncharacterized protein n=1 Tax=Caerostris extrusa TaxID=172846 RepID=A0AAV4Y834_CAEEX|nr:hypothetical protein CEXT_520691 [Caerostris extrusa]
MYTSQLYSSLRKHFSISKHNIPIYFFLFSAAAAASHHKYLSEPLQSLEIFSNRISGKNPSNDQSSLPQNKYLHEIPSNCSSNSNSISNFYEVRHLGIAFPLNGSS